jgi:aminopeptidase N
MYRKLSLVACFFMLSASSFAQLPPIEPGVSHELAIWRAAHYSDVRYKLNFTLGRMSPVLNGTIEINVNVSSRRPADAVQAGSLRSDAVPAIILDWRKIAGHEKDSTVKNITLNEIPLFNGDQQPVGIRPSPAFAYHESNEHLILSDGVRQGENVIKLDFTSPVLASGSAITRYVDKEDGSEYLYSLFVPSDASTAFPVFDQPDLKARFTLSVSHPGDWNVVSNGKPYAPTAEQAIQRCVARMVQDCGALTLFTETKSISTYVFAFAAGPWIEESVPPAVAGGSTRPQDITRSASGRNASTKAAGSKAQLQPPATAGGTDLLTHIYVRKSQAEKFKPHAAEVFRLTREGIKYLEEYFNYKYPFPKYDIVLIPEFPFGGMEHAGATFLRESSIIFPSEPTANDYISRANVIFHEAAHQWFGDTVTMRWFDDLWLKEGFAEFMAYKTLERVMPQYNAWKAFYERNKQAAYLTDSTRGTTPIYQEILNLSAAKSAYGNIVYRKAPSFLRQAEFYLGPDKFQTAVRAFLKKHEFGNAEWKDLVGEFEAAYGKDLTEWADFWVKRPGITKIRITQIDPKTPPRPIPGYITLSPDWTSEFQTEGFPQGAKTPLMKGIKYARGTYRQEVVEMGWSYPESWPKGFKIAEYEYYFIFPNYKDYGYGIFLLDDKSRDYVLKNIQNEKDDFLRSMMWGALWDSVREAELDPREYVELAVKNLPTEKDEMITASVLGRVSTAMTYYVSEPPAVAGGGSSSNTPGRTNSGAIPPANAGGSALVTRLEAMLIERMRTAPTLGQRLTYYRAFLNIASTESARIVLKEMLKSEPPASAGGQKLGVTSTNWPAANAAGSDIPLKTKDRFDIVTRLATLGDPEAPKLLAELEKTETSDDAKRYAYAARAAFPTKENREKFWSDFVGNKDISESWIEAAMVPFNSPRHSDLSLPYLQRALAELPNLKRNRKIFFVNGWLGAFIGGQQSREALDIVNKFLADNPNLDRDLRLKVLENVDVIERAVKIRAKFGK